MKIAVLGGGHGGYKLPVYAPASVQENADFMFKAFDTAEKYRTPVILLSDAAIGQMMGSVELPAPIEHDINKFSWTLKGRDAEHPVGRKMTDVIYYDYAYDDYDPHIRERYRKMHDELQEWEEVCCDDADIIMVAYGISSRVCKEAIKLGRAEGLKVGLLRPITLWPFPEKALEKFNGRIKGYLTVEMNACGQMVEDVALHAKGTKVYSDPTGRKVADSEELVELVRSILAGNVKEAY